MAAQEHVQYAISFVSHAQPTLPGCLIHIQVLSLFAVSDGIRSEVMSKAI